MCEALNKKIQYILVDEFQDTNFSQLCIVKELSKKNKNICVVGDDDQSIYGWRGALTAIFSKFSDLYPKVSLVKLEQNYRSTNVILKASNAVIEKNIDRISKSLWSNHEGESPIVVCCLKDDLTEAYWIAKKCLSFVTKGYSLKDIGILYRTNSQANYVEQALRELRLKYETFGGTSFFERREVKDFISYLRLVRNPDDHLSFWRVINAPSRGIGLKTMEKIEAIAREQNISPFRVVEKGLLKDLSSKQENSLKIFISGILEFSKSCVSSSINFETLCWQIIETFRLEDHIKMTCDNNAVAVKKLENLRTLPKCLSMAFSRSSGSEHADILEILDVFTLEEREKDPNGEVNKNFISLMTIHAAKGLEFPIVFLCGLEDGLLPHRNCLDNQLHLEEERRLFYVAITRAKERLFLSYSQEKYGIKREEFKLPSRFLQDIPEEIKAEDEENISLKNEGEEFSRKQKTASFLRTIREEIVR